MVIRKRAPITHRAGLIGSYVALACAAAPAAMAQEHGPSTAPREAAVLPKVTVEAQAADSNPYADPEAPYKADRLSSSKFTEPVLDTARTVTVLTKEILDDQNSTSLREIGRTTAGVTLGTGEGGNAFGDRFFIRGFDARNDVFVDGVRDPGVSVRENFFTEQVEILRGPASSFAGRGTTGGAINIVPKQAGDTDFYQAEGTLGTADMKRLTFDVNKALSPMWDARLSGMIQSADVAGRDFTTDKRNGIAGAVTFKPTANLVVKADFSHTRLYGLPDFGVPYNQVTQRPVTEGTVSRDTYYGIVNRDFTRTVQDMGTLDLSWRVSEALTLENKFRQSHSILDYIGTIPENPSANGATAAFSSNPTFFSGYTQLNAQSRYEPVNVVADQSQVTYAFNTGAMKHTAIVGGEFSRETVDINTYTGFTSELTTGPVAFTSNGAPIVRVDNPTHYLFGSGMAVLGSNPLRYRVNTSAGYAMDTANYNDFIIVNGGLRYDNYRITAANNTSSRSTDSGLSNYNIGLVIKPAAIGSFYGAYATAATPVGNELDATSSTYGGLAPTQNAAQIYGPQHSRALEAGTKWETRDRHLLLTAAVFENEVTNARETAPANLPGYTTGQIVSGASYRIRGLDLETAGNVTDAWSVAGGVVIMRSEVLRSIVQTNVGLEVANIAHRSFNLLTKYQVNPWLELGGQSIYASAIHGGSLLVANGGVPYPNPPRPTTLPAHWRFDAFAETALGAHTTVKLYAQNLFDETYYDSLYQSVQPFIAVAPGRSLSLIATVKF